MVSEVMLACVHLGICFPAAIVSEVRLTRMQPGVASRLRRFRIDDAVEDSTTLASTGVERIVYDLVVTHCD